jgi:hypothetical protein
MKMGIKEYFDGHTDQRLLCKYAFLCAGGIVLAYATADIAQVPPEYYAFATMALAYLNEKFKLLNPLEPWPIVGAGKKKR